MNGELANAIALALHGSAWLLQENAAPPDLERVNTTFQYIGRTTFEPPARRLRRAAPIGTSGEWLSWLRKGGATRIWLTLPAATGALPPHVASAFAHGGQWGLLATGGRPSLWIPSWEVGDRDAPDNRIWSVRLVGSWADDLDAPSPPHVDDAAEALRLSLIDAGDVARGQNLDFWANWFDEAIRCWEVDDTEIPFHPDMAPGASVSTEAFRLLAMATKSWVFGGMGSWNDVWLEEPAAQGRIDEVSRRLYEHMLEAFVAATNTRLVHGAR